MEPDRVSNELVYDHIYNGGFTWVNVPHNHCVVASLSVVVRL